MTERAFPGGVTLNYLIACSVRGDTDHARYSRNRISLCGEENVSLINEPFDCKSAFSCKKCRRILEKIERAGALREKGGKP